MWSINLTGRKMEDRHCVQNKKNVPPSVGYASAQERRTPSHGQLSLGQ